MQRKRIALLVSTLALVGVAVPVISLAATGPVATTGNATSLAATHVVLNGVINPSYTDNIWFFEYSTSADFSSGNQTTAPVAVGSGTKAVSATVRGLTPGTVYYYRVGVGAQPNTSAAPIYNLGDTASFTTLTSTGKPAKGYGSGVLTSRTARLSGRTARIYMRCRGVTGVRCAGLAGVIAQAHGTLVSCGTARFSVKAPRTRTIVLRPSKPCLALVRQARTHRIVAAFIAVFSTDQAKLAERVTIAG